MHINGFSLLPFLLVSLYSNLAFLHMKFHFLSPPSLQSLTDSEGWLLLCRQISTKNGMESPHINSLLPEQTSVTGFAPEASHGCYPVVRSTQR